MLLGAHKYCILIRSSFGYNAYTCPYSFVYLTVNDAEDAATVRHELVHGVA